VSRHRCRRGGRDSQVFHAISAFHAVGAEDRSSANKTAPTMPRELTCCAAQLGRIVRDMSTGSCCCWSGMQLLRPRCLSFCELVLLPSQGIALARVQDHFASMQCDMHLGVYATPCHISFSGLARLEKIFRKEVEQPNPAPHTATKSCSCFCE